MVRVFDPRGGGFRNTLLDVYEVMGEVEMMLGMFSQCIGNIGHVLSNLESTLLKSSFSLLKPYYLILLLGSS